MGQHIIKRKAGSTLELNFTFDNGLPTKPIINPAYKTGHSEKNNFHAFRRVADWIIDWSEM